MTSPREQIGFRVLRKLAESSGVAGRPIFDDVQAADYDWGVPYHFNRRQLEKVQELGSSVAEALSEALGRHFRTAVPVRFDGARQAFRHRLDGELAGASSYGLPVADKAGPRGAIVVDAAAALAWIARLLGADEQRIDPERKLSELDSELLGDTVGSVLQAINGVFQKAAGPALTPGGGVCPGPVALPGEAEAEFCCLPFWLPSPADRPSLRVALSCEVLDLMVGAGDADAPGALSPEAARAALTEHVTRAPVTVAAYFGQTELTMRELMNLEPGDVLLLHGPACGPIELRVAQRAVAEGYAVTCNGRYAIEVSRSLAVPQPGQAARHAVRATPQKGK